METMQTVVGIKMEAPQVFDKLDKKYVRKVAEIAVRLKLGSAEFNDKSHIFNMQPNNSNLYVPKDRHRFWFAYENQVSRFL